MTRQTLQGLEEICRTYVPGARMAFLGGSMNPDMRGRDVGRQSDYDVVVIAKHVFYPMSYNGLIHPADGRSIDLIVRDPETLAFDFLDARQRGKPVVPNIVASGAILFDDKNQAQSVKESAYTLIENGPLKMHDAEYMQCIQKLSRDMLQIQVQGNETLNELMLPELAHNIGTLYLRSQRSWHGAGKFLPARLQPHDVFRENLECAAAKKDALALLKLLPHPTGHEKRYCDPLLTRARQEKNDKLRDHFLISYDRPYQQDALSFGNKEQRKLARSIMAEKLCTLAKAVDAERYGRAPDQYDYALTRFVMTWSEFNADDNHHNWQGTTFINQRYQQFLAQSPEILSAVNTARSGAPEHLHNLAADFIHELQPQPQKVAVRRAPANFRADPALFFKSGQ